MSRLGKLPVDLPTGVKAFIEGGSVRIEGPKGKLTLKIPSGVELSLDQNKVLARRLSDSADHKAKHGLIRALVRNMVSGVATGYERRMEIVGVGFKAALKGKVLNMSLGFSHPVDFDVPEGITVKVENNTNLVLQSPDKSLLGETCAKIRGFRPPEPYQGKGIRFAGEKVRRKAGKAAAGGK